MTLKRPSSKPNHEDNYARGVHLLQRMTMKRPCSRPTQWRLTNAKHQHWVRPIHHHHRHHYPVGSITNTITTPIDDDDDGDFESEKPTTDKITIRPKPSTPKPRFSRVKQAVTLPKELAKQELSSKESGVLSVMVSRTREWINDLKPGAYPPLYMTFALPNIHIHPVLPPNHQPRWSACPFITIGIPSRTGGAFVGDYWNATRTSRRTTMNTRAATTGRQLAM